MQKRQEFSRVLILKTDNFTTLFTQGLKLKTNKQLNNNNKSMLKKPRKQSDSLEENGGVHDFSRLPGSSLNFQFHS